MLLPQLNSALPVQYHLRRRLAGYRAANHLAGGTVITGANNRPPKRTWDLEYKGLVTAEISSLGNFCSSSEAAVDGFEFLDPFSNLLAYSESLTADPWVSDALANVTELPLGVSDEARSHAIQNGGIVEQSVRQELGITGYGTFCASMFVRSDVMGSGRIVVGNSSEAHAVEFTSRSEWSQVYLSAGVSTEAAPLSFSIGVGPGCTIHVREVQLECQLFPSRYKPTWETGGVYAGARVVHGSFQVLQHGPDWFDCSFQVEA